MRYRPRLLGQTLYRGGTPMTPPLYGRMNGEDFIRHFEGPAGRAHPLAEWEMFLAARKILTRGSPTPAGGDPEIAKVRARRDAVLGKGIPENIDILGRWRVVAPFIDTDGV